MAEWIVSEWRESSGSERVLIIAITEALKVIPAVVGDLEAEIAELRKWIQHASEDIRHGMGTADPKERVVRDRIADWLRDAAIRKGTS